MSGSVVLMSRERRDVTCCASIKLAYCVTATRKLQMCLGFGQVGLKFECVKSCQQ